MLRLNKIKTFILGITFALLSTQTAHAATYTVTKGDTLFSLGRLFNTNVASITSTNKINGTSIYIGQTLTMPGTYHTVLTGETLFSISRKYGIPVDSIRKANAQWSDVIIPGQKLLIPNGVTSTTAAAVTTTTTTTVTTSTAATRPAVIPYTAADLDLLARLVRAEAENQTYRAKVAVAAVVVNRVKSSLFPNTLRDVIYERSNGYYQFTPVVNGHINKIASQSDINAAREALHGADPTNGALFYFDDSTTSSWLWSRKVALRDGNMVYSY